MIDPKPYENIQPLAQRSTATAFANGGSWRCGDSIVPFILEAGTFPIEADPFVAHRKFFSEFTFFTSSALRFLCAFWSTTSRMKSVMWFELFR